MPIIEKLFKQLYIMIDIEVKYPVLLHNILIRHRGFFCKSSFLDKLSLAVIVIQTSYQ